MRAFSFIVVAGWLGSGIPTAAQTPPIRLVPAAAEVQWGEPIAVGGEAAIVVADQAEPAEREAARLLGRNVEKRFGRRWPILSVRDVPANMPLRVVLGQPRRFAALDGICTAQKLTVPSQQDGYALKVWSDGATVTAAVAGATGRGVIYGQDTLFQLFARRDDTLTVRAAVIRDWPTIPLRGRPHPHYQYFLKPENFDCIMTSRINFIDLRDGIYAFEPGARLNKEELGTVIRQARDRGLRVYAAVNCGVPGAQQDAVIATFREFIELGADGLWASFDDKGAGADPKGMVTRILALGREHGITGDAIAVTPPKGDYQTIRTRFNREIIAVPGMEKAVWYWTSVPCAQDAADAEAVGLRVRPSWWHNWPRFRLPPFHTGSDRSYSPVISLADGWNHPNEEELREMGRYVHAVLPWDGWQAQQHYLVPMIGWWSWRPEQYDFQTVRGRIHDVVFGPGQVETAAAIDDALDTLRRRFRFWSTHTEFAPQCPPRLLSPEDRARTLAGFRALQGKLAALQEGARTASLLDPELLEQDYLGPMMREIETGLAAAQAPYPEYWWQEHQDSVLEAIYDGEAARADQLIRRTRERVLEDIAQVERLLGDSNGVRRYVAWWRARARATAADWQQLVTRRREALQERIADYGRTVAPIKGLLGGLNDPPVQLGTGAWKRHNHLRAVVLPEPRERFWGDWIGGIHEAGDVRVAAFAAARHEPTNAGAFSELPVNVPLSGRRDRLALLLYLADANKESFGLGYAKWRWSGYRAIRLFWGERELWKADLGIPRLSGEWFAVPLPTLPDELKTLPLRLRVEDYSSEKNNLEIVYVGPIRLIELDRD